MSNAGEGIVVTTGSGRAYDAILTLVQEGAFAPGDSLREASLADSIGVSRTPVREALRRLAAEGIVEFHPNRGSTVVAYDNDDVAEFFLIRALLEPEAAAKAAARRDDQALELLTSLLAEMDDAVALGDRTSLAQLNAEFHNTIVKTSGSRVLPELIELVAKKPIVQRTFNRYTDAQLRRSQEHHRELVEAIRIRNSSLAHAIMRVHILAARALYIDTDDAADYGIC